ncbi:hypothetical protein HDV57DRAFT_398695 [Trichoderma longibrachiatum]
MFSFLSSIRYSLENGSPGISRVCARGSKISREHESGESWHLSNTKDACHPQSAVFPSITSRSESRRRTTQPLPSCPGQRQSAIGSRLQSCSLHVETLLVLLACFQQVSLLANRSDDTCRRGQVLGVVVLLPRISQARTRDM